MLQWVFCLSITLYNVELYATICLSNEMNDVGVSISAGTGDSIHCMLVVGKWLPFWVEQSSHHWRLLLCGFCCKLFSYLTDRTFSVQWMWLWEESSFILSRITDGDILPCCAGLSPYEGIYTGISTICTHHHFHPYPFWSSCQHSLANSYWILSLLPPCASDSYCERHPPLHVILLQLILVWDIRLQIWAVIEWHISSPGWIWSKLHIWLKLQQKSAYASLEACKAYWVVK